MGETAPVESMKPFTIRRFCAEDAEGVKRLVESVYEDTYYPRDLYTPAQIVELNREERLVSIVSVNPANQVIGHYALERPNLEAVAEASDAIVAIDCRHHHLLEEMRPLLREQAKRLGLIGLVGYPVTNHLFSQRAEDHFGSYPCGVALGLWPRSFHNMPEAMPQRMSFVIYFDYVSPTVHVVHEAAPHREIISRIYKQYGISHELCDKDSDTAETGTITVESEPEVQTGTIRVSRVGTDTVAAVLRARDQLCDEGAKAITLELPLVQSQTADLCAAAEDDGFFFSGLGPGFATDGDALLMQFVVEDIALSLIQIQNPFAKELLAYAGSERERVTQVLRRKRA